MMTTTTTPSATTPRTALFEHLIDDAGLFPPAQLAMDAALKENAKNRAGTFRWVMGRFVVPASRLDELASAKSNAATPLKLTVILDGPGLAPRWIDGVRSDVERAYNVGKANADALAIESFEVRLPPTADAALIADLCTTVAERFPQPSIAVEIPFAKTWAIAPAIAFAMLRDARANAPHLIAKLRCGGTVADAFPNATQLANAIAEAHRNGVPFKATAGLHHPLRSQVGAFEMHGFLNVLTAALAVAVGASEAELAAILEEEDRKGFRLDDTYFIWRRRRFDTAAVETMRRTAFLSYGSCSFTEPISDLLHASFLL